MGVQRKNPKVPLQQKATQVRCETKQTIKSDVKQNNQRLELNKELPSMPLKQKNCESPTNGRPRKRNSDTEVVQAQREINHKFNCASPTKQSPVTTTLTKNCGSPTGNLESRNTTKSCSSPTRNKTNNRASSKKQSRAERHWGKVRPKNK